MPPLVSEINKEIRLWTQSRKHEVNKEHSQISCDDQTDKYQVRYEGYNELHRSCELHIEPMQIWYKLNKLKP